MHESQRRRAFIRCLTMPLAVIGLLAGTALAQGRPPLIAAVGGETGGYVWASYTPDGKRIAYTRGTDEAMFVDPASGMLSQTISTGVGSISVASFSVDGTMLIVAGYESAGQAAEIYRVADGSLVGSFHSLADTIATVALSPDGTKLAVAGSSDVNGSLVGIVEIWSVSTGKRLRLLAANASNVTAVTYSRDGKTLAGVGMTAQASPAPGEVTVWDTATGNVTATSFLSTLAPNALSYSPDGKSLVVGGGGASANLLLLNATSLAPITGIDVGVEIRSLAVGPSGRYIAVGGDSSGAPQTAAVVDTSTGTVRPMASSPQATQAVGFSTDGSQVVVAGFSIDAQFDLIGVLHVGLTVNGAVVSDLSTNQSVGSAVAVSHNGSFLAVGGYSSHFTGVVQVWNLKSGQFAGSAATRANGVLSEAFSPAESAVAVTGYRVTPTNDYLGIAEIWSVPARRLTLNLPTSLEAVYASAFSPDGTLLAITGSLSPGSPSTVVEIWQVSTGKLFSKMTSGALLLNSLAFSPDGLLLLAGGYRNAGNGTYPAEVDVWSVSNGQAPFIIKSAANQGLYGVAFAPDGKTFATAGARAAGSSTSGVVEIWNAATGARVKSISVGDLGAYSIGYSAIGNALYIGTNQHLKVYSAVTYAQAQSYDQETSFVRTIAFGPSGTPVAYGRIDGRVLIADDPYAVPYTFKLTSTSVTGGGSVGGILTLSKPAPPEGITFTITSDTPLLAGPAISSVTLPHGQTRSTITIRTYRPGATAKVRLTVSQGTSPASAVLTVGK